MHPEMKLVSEDERPIVPCPPAMREGCRRALAAKIADLHAEVGWCRRRALEGGFQSTAEALASLRALTGGLAAALAEEA